VLSNLFSARFKLFILAFLWVGIVDTAVARPPAVGPTIPQDLGNQPAVIGGDQDSIKVEGRSCYTNANCHYHDGMGDPKKDGPDDGAIGFLCMNGNQSGVCRKLNDEQQSGNSTQDHECYQNSIKWDCESRGPRSPGECCNDEYCDFRFGTVPPGKCVSVRCGLPYHFIYQDGYMCRWMLYSSVDKDCTLAQVRQDYPTLTVRAVGSCNTPFGQYCWYQACDNADPCDSQGKCSTGERCVSSVKSGKRTSWCEPQGQKCINTGECYDGWSCVEGECRPNASNSLTPDRSAES
jgi:hypothetical protein